MQKRSTLFYVGVAFVILLISFLLFSLFPRTIPEPEITSPWAYVVALLLLVIAFIRMRDRSLILRYLPIPLLAFFALGEEVSYGVESGFWDALHWDALDLPVYDAHNLVPALYRLMLERLGLRNWDSATFSQFLLIDLLIAALAIGFVIALRYRAGKLKLPNWRDRVLQFSAAIAIVLPLLAIGYLLTLPRYASNAILLGFSASRLAAILALLLVAAAALWLTLALRNKKTLAVWRAKIENFLNNKTTNRLLGFALGFSVVAILLFQAVSSFNTTPEKIVLLERVTPLAAWALAQALLLWLALLAWNGRMRQPLVRALDPLRAFFVAHPAYVFVAFAAFIIVISQAFDKGWISVNEIINISSFWVDNWNYWIEEIFETTAAFEFAAASFLLPRASAKKKK
jgi:hypothetical protein